MVSLSVGKVYPGQFKARVSALRPRPRGRKCSCSTPICLWNQNEAAGAPACCWRAGLTVLELGLGHSFGKHLLSPGRCQALRSPHGHKDTWSRRRNRNTKRTLKYHSQCSDTDGYVLWDHVEGKGRHTGKASWRRWCSIQVLKDKWTGDA